MSVKSILVVDDSGADRANLERIVSSAGCVVNTAANGRDALAAAKANPPDLIFLDIVMPEMDGIELARRATQLDPDLKVMFITGFAAVALNPDSDAPKDAKVLSKPFHLRELVAEVEKMIAA